MARHLLMPGINHYIHRVLDVGNQVIETILDGNTYIQDATTFNGTPDLNEGSTTAINILEGGAKARGLIRVLLSTIPTNAIIQSAKFTFYVQTTQPLYVLRWHRTLIGDWFETQATWKSARTGELWAGSAGQSTGQVDVWRSKDLQNPLPAAVGWQDMEFNALGIQSIQEMVRGNLYNNGWRVHITGASTMSMRSRNYAGSSSDPIFTIEYTLGPDIATLVATPIFDMQAELEYLWQDYALESTPVTLRGQAVGAWTDSITGFLQVAYSTSGYDGVYNNAALPIWKRTVTFAADAKYRGLTSNELDEPGGARTYHIVLASSSAAENTVFMHATTAQLAARFDINDSTGNPKIVFGSSAYTIFDPRPEVDDGELHIYTVTFYDHTVSNMDLHRVRIDGVEIPVESFSSSGALTAWNELQIGGDSAGSNRLTGELARILGYDSVLSADDIDQNELYLGNKFQIPLGVDPVDLLTNMVSWWPLDEASGSALDSHGSNDLTDINTVTQWLYSPRGAVTSSRDFEAATDEHFSIASNASLQTGDIDFTFLGWFAPESNNVNGMRILGKWDTGIAEYRFYFDYGSQTWIWEVSSDGTATTQLALAGTPGSYVDEWFFFVVDHDATNDLISLQLWTPMHYTTVPTKYTAAHAGGVYTGAADFNVGSIASDTTVGHWDGYMSNIVFTKELLTEAQRLWYFNYGKCRLYSSLV